MPLNGADWCRLYGNKNFANRVVKQETLPDGKWVSTTLIGLDHRFIGDGPPLIFETMVFPEECNWSELDVRRYATEEEARAGHEEMVRYWSGETADVVKEITEKET